MELIYNGTEYKSIKSIAKDLEISYDGLVRNIKKTGNLNEAVEIAIANKKGKYTAFGIEFDDILNLTKHFEVNYDKCKRLINAGEKPDRAIELCREKKEMHHAFGKEYSSIREVAEEYGVNMNSVSSIKRNTNMSLEEIINRLRKPKNKALGLEYNSLSGLAKRYGVYYPRLLAEVNKRGIEDIDSILEDLLENTLKKTGEDKIFSVFGVNFDNIACAGRELELNISSIRHNEKAGISKEKSITRLLVKKYNGILIADKMGVIKCPVCKKFILLGGKDLMKFEHEERLCTANEWKESDNECSYIDEMMKKKDKQATKGKYKKENKKKKRIKRNNKIVINEVQYISKEEACNINNIGIGNVYYEKRKSNITFEEAFIKVCEKYNQKIDVTVVVNSVKYKNKTECCKDNRLNLTTVGRCMKIRGLDFECAVNYILDNKKEKLEFGEEFKNKEEVLFKFKIDHHTLNRELAKNGNDAEKAVETILAKRKEREVWVGNKEYKSIKELTMSMGIDYEKFMGVRRSNKELTYEELINIYFEKQKKV